MIIGVAGAGTMGSGIAQLACASGAQTLLYDALPGAAERGAERVMEGLEGARRRGKLSAEEVKAAWDRLTAVDALEALAPCDLVIEAAPESLPLKLELFGALAHGIVGRTCVLASNTSSIPITAIAAGVPQPERVIGMHFFNPAPVMKLMELIAGLQSGAEALALGRRVGEAMGRRVIDAADGPGFLVNRCGRPFGLEALRALQEGLADVETIDRIARLGGGFRMGPFELQDLVGIDTGFAVAQSFAELSFGEPRWRPSPLSARMVAAGRFGRKTGRGWYAYEGGAIVREPDPPAPEPGGGDGRVLAISGSNTVADELRVLAANAGWQAVAADDSSGEVPFLALDCGGDGDELWLPSCPVALLCAWSTLAARGGGGPAVGFHALPPLKAGGLVELTRSSGTSDIAAARAEEVFASLGLHTAWVGDAPGLVLGRLVAQLVNEAAFAVGEGVGSPADVDAGMVLGLNHPRGPLAWGDLIGLDGVLAILDGLHAELGDPAYRAAPLLRRMVLEGLTGGRASDGFHPGG